MALDVAESRNHEQQIVSAAPNPAREVLRHTVATLAYRAEKAVRHAPPEFANFRVAADSRTPVEIVAHMGDLMDWALCLARGQHRWRDATPLPWDEEVQRFFAGLAAFDTYLASAAPLGRSVERLFQGPVADALTHTGQLTMLRRAAGSPIRGENYAKAKVLMGRVGMDQASERVEFD